jgi:hypothetical protein
MARKIGDACKNAELECTAENAENLRNGIDRPTDDGGDNGCFVSLGSDMKYVLKKPEYIDSVRIIFDSDLNRETLKGGIQVICDCPTVCNRPLDMTPYTFPSTMVKGFEVYADDELVCRVDDNCQRLVKIPIGKECKSVALRPMSTYGDETAHIFSFDFS